MIPASMLVPTGRMRDGYIICQIGVSIGIGGKEIFSEGRTLNDTSCCSLCLDDSMARGVHISTLLMVDCIMHAGLSE